MEKSAPILMGGAARAGDVIHIDNNKVANKLQILLDIINLHILCLIEDYALKT
jgi:hypothetical protein